MPKKIDLTNKQFGEWLVIREATKIEKNNRPGAFWLCRCSCGTERIMNGQVLRENQSFSCGCKTSQRLSESHKGKTLKDIVGQRFGRLVVLERDFEEEKKHPFTNTYWKCQCDCGNIVTVVKSSLTTGATKSCGCLQKEIAAKSLAKTSANNFIDETGHQYGKLTVLYRAKPHPTMQGVQWHCKCECGNECDVMGSALRAGNTNSCGCLNISKGEFFIEQLLSANNIIFVKEFPLKQNNKTYRFDFAIFKGSNLIYLIEFDGAQHFYALNLFGGEKQLLQTKTNDTIKNQWCKDNNIPLIRIPYTHLKNLCIDDLLLETSQFII